MKYLWACGLLGCLVAAPAFGADATADDSQQRQRLAAERAVAQARFEATARECRSAFAVTGCLDQAKAERRRTLDRIARDETALDDAQRRRRAEERRQRIAAKQQAAAARAAASAPDVKLRAPRPDAPASSASRPSRRAEARTREEQAAEEAAARERAEQSQRRRERAAAHEEAVRQRNAERAARKPPAAPLPVPASAPQG
jgi:hypothetical protein